MYILFALMKENNLWSNLYKTMLWFAVWQFTLEVTALT